MEKPKLIAPVSDFATLRAAIDSGADAVYFGVKTLNMRITAKNFEAGQLRKIAALCREKNVMSHLCIYAIVYDSELEKVRGLVSLAKKAGIDAIICWDLAVIKIAKELGMKFIVSTQASIANTESAKYYENLGAEAVVLARELSLEQVRAIKKNVNVKIEAFIHGAMCVSLSGRCFLSHHLFQKSANRGDCLQPCRRKYIVKDVEDGKELVLGEDYVLSAKDLCTLPFIEQLIESGIDMFKIEGRARPPEYVKTTVSVYRRAIDSYFEKKLDEKLKQKLLSELETVYHREFSGGFYFGRPDNGFCHPESKAKETKHYAGRIKNYFAKLGVAEVKVTAYELKAGDKIIIQGETTGVKEAIVKSMQFNHKQITKAEKGKGIGLKVDFVVRPNDKVFVLTS